MEAVTLQDIADKCNVHKSTVYRALIGSKRVGEATTLQIRRVADEMGYDHTLNLSARQLSARKTGRTVVNHLVVLFLPQGFLDDFYYSFLFRGIQTELRRENYDLIVSALEDDGEGELPLAIVRGDVDGVLMLCRQNQGEQLLRKIESKGNISHCPTISVMAPLAGCSSVVADERDGGRIALRHLLELGHRRVLFISGHNVPPYHLNERLAGYREACREAGVDFEETVTVHLIEPNASLTDSLRGVVARYFCGPPRFSAVLTRNDSHAVLLRRALLEQGLRVPDDLSLIGFDDTRPLSLQYAEMNENFLSTVQLPLKEIGKAAAHLLLDTLSGKVERQTNLTLPVSLVIRQTTAAPMHQIVP